MICKKMANQSIHSPDILENGKMCTSLSDVDAHFCSICELKFSNLTDLERHSQIHDKRNTYKCSLCNDVFTDLKQLKVHDLRHSLEEAEEDVTDIEQMILPFGLKSCDMCGEKFSCDEELINHSVHHRVDVKIGTCEVEFSSDEELMNQPGSSTDNEEGHVNYPILRQEVVKDKSGRTDIHFVLIDHQNEYVEEYTHTIHDQVANRKGKRIRKNTKGTGRIVTNKSTKMPKVVKKRTKVGIDVVKISDDEDVSFVKSLSGAIKHMKSKDDVSKRVKPKDIATKHLKSENEINIELFNSKDNANVYDSKYENDNVCEDIGLNNKSRRSKQMALKKKIWNEKIYLPPPQKLKDCPTCNKSFGDMDDFKKHILTHKPKSEPSEEQSIFHNLDNKKTAIKVKKESDSENGIPDWIEIVCDICYNRFCMKKGLRKHLINVHKLDSKKVSYYLGKVPHNTASYHVCKICKKQFYKKSRLHSHSCHPAINVICELCKQRLSSKAALKRHLLTSHKLGESKTNSIMDQLSNYNHKFYKKPDLGDEVVISSSDGRFVSRTGSKLNFLQGKRCETCYKAFAGDYELKGHKCYPTIEIKCEICKYNSPSKYNLKRHIMCIHKFSLNECENIMTEFKCYNEKLKLRHPILGRKKNSFNKSLRSSAKSPTSSKAPLNKNMASSIISSKNIDSQKKNKLKILAKEILSNKDQKLLTGYDQPKKVLNKSGPLSRKFSSGFSLTKKSNSSISSSFKKIKTPAGLSSSKKLNTSTCPSSSNKRSSSQSLSSKKSKLSNMAKKKEKMKHTSAGSIKNVAAKKLITKSRKYFGKNASSRLLRSNKK